MKKIITLGMIILTTIALMGVGKNDKQKPLEVVGVTNTMYAELYSDHTVYKKFNNELNMAESFSNAWYDIHEGNEKTMVSVKQIDTHRFVVVYDNGEKITFKYKDELECAETYTDVWYEIYE